MIRHLRRHSRQLLSPETWRTRLLFWTGATLMGLLASLFALGASRAGDIFRSEILSRSPLLPFLITPLGLGLIAFVTSRYVKGAQGSGIPQAIAALSMREHATRRMVLSFRIAIGKILLTILGLLCGASIGREGPTVHVGASIMFGLERFGRFPYHYLDRGLILAGGAAGIAAAFNTPLAGIMFAIEEMGRSFEERNSGTLITAVFLAGIITVAIQGNYTYFGITDVQLQIHQIFLPIVTCGLIGGILGGLFSTGLIVGSRRLARFYRCCPVRVAMVAGLAVALIGYLSGGLTYGTGYEQAKLLVTGQGEMPLDFSILKLLATIASYLSGIPGGIFAPSLATGAGVGSTIAHWLPDLPVQAVVILGMVGYFTGVVQTPMTAFIIVLEMTEDSAMVLPIMATAFLAFAASRLVCPTAIYQALAEDFLTRAPGQNPG